MTETLGDTWAVFGLELSPRLLASVRADAEARYPREACGLGLGRAGAPQVDRVIPITNVAEQPATFSFDPREHLAALERADEEGRVERLVYHSHPDAGAYLSAVDRASLAPAGHAERPDLVHLVVEVRPGLAGEIAAFRWNPETLEFDEAHPAPPTLPDLELRGGPSTRPIAPVGGRLAGRRLGPWEAERLAGWAEGRRLVVDADTARTVAFFERGFLSPLIGFQRHDEIRAVEALGRLPRGVPWRTPLPLDLQGAPGWPSGQVIELADESGKGLALMVVAERREMAASRVCLGGPLFCYPSGGGDAWSLRAEWLSAGAVRILAVPVASAAWVRAVLDISDFDALLVGGPLEPWIELGRLVRSLAEIPRAPWLTAAMAQNQGATHIALPGGVTRREMEALDIEGLYPPAARGDPVPSPPGER